MALFQGFKEQKVPFMGGYVDWGNPTAHPLGLAIVGKNVRYLERSVSCRYGLKSTMSEEAGARPTGLAMLNYIRATQTDVPLIFYSNGKLYQESPVGSGTRVEITPSVGSLSANKYMQAALAYNNAYLAFSDLKTGAARPYVVNGGTLNLDPAAGKLFGGAWQAATAYVVGEIVSPATANGHLYRCTVAGTSGGVEPAFPTGDGATVADNGITWTEYTPNAGTFLPAPDAPSLSISAGAGTWAAGRDVYVKRTFVNGNGETVGSVSSKITNTTLNDRIVVAAVSAPSWLSGLGAPYAITGYEVYTADVATGGAVPTNFLKVAGGPHALNVATNVDAAGAGSAIPTTNTATITGLGHICAGDRPMMILYRDRNGTICGAADAGVISFNVPVDGQKLFVGNIPVGPSYIADRILCFGLSGASAAGPLKYVSSNDIDPNGIDIDTTIIPNNTDTHITLDFTDVYLADATDATNALLYIGEIPACVDIYYSPSLRKIIYTGAEGYESGFLLSQTDKPGEVRGGIDVVQVAENDGYRTICWREFQNGEQLAFKENGCYQIDTSDVTPAKWNPIKRWGGDKTGTGPVGPRALDLADAFLVYVHTSGVYRYPWIGDESDRGLVSREISDFWARINWTYKHLIAVHIDTENEEVRIALPIDGATVPNKTLTLNYHNGWTDPVHFTQFGRPIAGRKWSVDDIAASQFLAADRTLVTPVDSRIDKKQILVASSTDGKVNMIVPDQFNDNGLAIDQQYQPAYMSIAGYIMQLGGIQATVRGVGTVTVQGMTAQSEGEFDMRELTLPASLDHLYLAEIYLGTSETFGALFTNKNEADSYFELSEMKYWVRAWETARQG